MSAKTGNPAFLLRGNPEIQDQPSRLGTSLASFLSQLSNPKLSLNRHSALSGFVMARSSPSLFGLGIHERYIEENLKVECNSAFFTSCNSFSAHFRFSLFTVKRYPAPLVISFEIAARSGLEFDSLLLTRFPGGKAILQRVSC